MNDELSKALDGAIADAAEMGTLKASEFPYEESPGRWRCIVPSGDKGFAIAYGSTESEAIRRARLIVESVNGRAAMAKRIAELEKALEKIVEDYCTPGTDHYDAWNVASKALAIHKQSKGNTP